jgi:AraC family transcriptional regulator of arabinose operon
MIEMAEYPNNHANPEAVSPPPDVAIAESWTHPPGILVSDYYYMPYGYFCYRSNGTKDWLVMYTLSGKGIIKNGGRELESRDGDITIIPPGTPHFYYTAQDHVWEKLWAHFMPRVTWLDWLRLPKTAHPIIHMNIRNKTHRTYIRNAFKRVISYNLEPLLTYREELAMNALEEIILLVSSEESEDTVIDPRIKEVLHILSQQYMEHHRIEDLAKRVCLSASRLTHLFKEQVGESIVETLLKFRLKQAEKKLTFTDRTVTEIALEVGFNSPDYFTRQFVKYYGVSPTQYRKSLKLKSSK